MSTEDLDLTATLTALRAQRESVKSNVDECQRRLLDLQNRLESLTQAVTALERLVSPGMQESPEPAKNVEAGASSTPEPSTRVSIEGQDVEVLDVEVPKTPRRRKVRSTQMVIDFLSRASEPKSRDELMNHFRDLGVLDIWANPENALNTAILRAKDSGSVVELPDGRLSHADRVSIDEEN